MLREFHINNLTNKFLFIPFRSFKIFQRLNTP